MDIEEIIDEVRKRVKIREEEREHTSEAINEVLEKLEEKKKELGIEALIEVHGSFAHDTWISGDKDIDIFIIMRSENVIEEALKIAKSAFPNHIERYAEHPFITVEHKGYNFDIVPAYLIEKGEKIKTATDRTRLHTQYLKEVLNDELRQEIRILKLFLKTLDLYGAEIKTGGMSGYLCELLIIHYGSFLNLIKSAIKWKPYKTVIGEWKGKPEPIVVVDPVDNNRNVASSFKKYDLFKYACMLFLKNPSMRFFEGRKYCSDLNKAEELFSARGSEILVLEFDYPKIPPDQFWGEIQRAKRSLVNFLENQDFEVFDSNVYSDEKSKAAIILEVKSYEVPKARILLGPPILKIENSYSFIEKHEKDPIWVKEGRLISFPKRKITDLKTAIHKWISTHALPKDLIQPLSKAKIYSIKESNDEGIKRAIFDLAFKDLWWVREELLKAYNITLI